MITVIPQSLFLILSFFLLSIDAEIIAAKGSSNQNSHVDKLQNSDITWHDSSYSRRGMLNFGKKHAALSAGQTFYFEMESGTRNLIADNAHFNWGFNTSHNYHVCCYDNKIHVVYLSKYVNAIDDLGIYVVSSDDYGKSWNNPVYCGSAHTKQSSTDYDTHHFPSITVDNDGYLYLFYGCHYNRCYYKVSAEPNRVDRWSSERQLPAGEYSANQTYPWAFCIPSTGRVYVLARAGNYYQMMWYSDNRGASWAGPYPVIYYSEQGDVSGNGRTYCYGHYFDRNKERLYLGITFTDSEGQYPNVYEAYSDFDSEGTYGFDDWYKHGSPDTRCGRTNGSGTGVEAPINKTNAGKIVDAEDMLQHGKYLNQYFIWNIHLREDGSPIYYYDMIQGVKRDIDRCETALQSAAWNSDSHKWDRVGISSELDQLVRATDLGGAGILDKNGVLRFYTTCAGKTHCHQLPDTDAGSANAALSSGSTGHSLVDDGVMEIDGDITSIELIDSGAFYEFAGSAYSVNPAFDIEGKTVLAVEVEVWAMNSFPQSTTPQIRLYLESGGAKDEGTEQAVSSAFYRSYKSEWETNPFRPRDKEPWTWEAARDVRFGIKQTASEAEVRFTVIRKKILYTEANDRRHASDVLYVFSNDKGGSGGSWKSMPLTGNSSIGLPRVSLYPYLCNNGIQTAFNIGSNIHYIAESEIHRQNISFNAEDIKLFYGTTEIDRCIQNSGSSARVYFRLQSDMARNSEYADSAYYVYYGRDRSGSSPKSDPDNVYQFFENWEWVDNNISVDGFNGWTNEGRGLTYGQTAPPQEAQKTVCGSGYLKLFTLPARLSKSTASSLEDVRFVINMHPTADVADPRSYIYFDGDSASNEFRFGSNSDTKNLCYFDGKWHDNDYQHPSAGYQHNEIRITNSGITAWVGGHKILDEIPGIKTVDKIGLAGNRGGTLFDFIYAYSDIEETYGWSTVAGQGIIGDYRMTPNPDSSSEYSSNSDAKFDITNTNADWEYISRMEITLRVKGRIKAGAHADFRIWICNTASYNPGKDDANIDTYSDVQISSPDKNGQEWRYKTVVFDAKESGNNKISLTKEKSIKVDFQFTDGHKNAEAEIFEIMLYGKNFNARVSLEEEEYRPQQDKTQ